MNQWPSVKAKRVLAALLRHGWEIKRSSGSHRILTKAGYPDFILSLQVGEVREHLVGTDALGEHLGDIRDPDTHPADTAAVPALARVGRDSGFQLLLVQGCVSSCGVDSTDWLGAEPLRCRARTIEASPDAASNVTTHHRLHSARHSDAGEPPDKRHGKWRNRFWGYLRDRPRFP